MKKLWISNRLDDRKAMLEQATMAHKGLSQQAVEKDWWVSATLQALFHCGCKESLLFKGGTSLSKAWNVINRFSEDIDLAIDHSFFGIDKTSKSQREKLRKMARQYIHGTFAKELDDQLRFMGVEGYRMENVTHILNRRDELTPIDSDKDPTVIMIHYPSICENLTGYIPPVVKIEISCLSMDEPVEMRNVRSFISETFPEEDDGTEGVYKTVMPLRTFLEKIFLLAEEFQKEKPRHVRMSRHLYDIERMMDTEYGRMALCDAQLYKAIVNHRRTYYALKYVDYDKHERSMISFLPPENLMADWREDYDNMRLSFIYGDALDFDALMERMREMQKRINCQF